MSEFDQDQPEFHIHHRVSNSEVLSDGTLRYTLLCDDGLDVEVLKAVKKMNKRLSKWGQEVKLISQEIIEKPHWMDLAASKTRPNWEATRKRPPVRQTKLVLESPPIAGKTAKLIGMFERAEEGDEVYRYAFGNMTSEELEPYLPRWNECDHCHKKRDRNSSFLCETTEGERVLIGRQCSMDYLGLHPAEILARDAVWKTLSDQGGEDEERPFGRFTAYYSTESLALLAHLVASRYGGYSREIAGKVHDDMLALEGARDYGRDTTYRDIREFYRTFPKPEPLDFAALADYVYSMQGDFGTNLRIALSAEGVHPKRKNLIVAGVGLFYGKAAKLKKVSDETPQAKLLNGAPDEKVEFTGKVVRTTPYNTDFGPKCAITIIADDGSRCVHFSAKEVNPSAGQRYKIKATIAKHDNEKVQTVLTRAKYEEAA